MELYKNNEIVVPDSPYPFGYKIGWYAIKNETTLSVIEKMKLKVVKESNWEDGINLVSEHLQYTFITPIVDGYVLVVNIVSDDEHNLVKKHALLFDELQYFGTHHVVEYNVWAKFLNGKVIRGYCFIGESNEIKWNEGEITTEEKNLGFDKFPANSDTLSADDFDYENLPNEEDVLNIAKAWGVDTTFSSGLYEKGVGFICETPGR